MNSRREGLELVDRFRVLGSGPGQFNTPVGMATDAADNVYVADSGNSRIQKFGDFSMPTKSTTWGRLKSLIADPA